MGRCQLLADSGGAILLWVERPSGDRYVFSRGHFPCVALTTEVPLPFVKLDLLSFIIYLFFLKFLFLFTDFYYLFLYFISYLFIFIFWFI